MNNPSKNTIKTILILIVPLILASPLFGESEKRESSPVIIQEIITEIEGSTGRAALIRELNLNEGDAFESLESLNTILKRKIQDLINMRVFTSIDYDLEKADEEYPDANTYRLILKAVDAFTFYPIPYYKYNSNSKHRAGLKLFYYNAFGTMTDWFFFSNLDINDNYGDWAVGEWHITPSVEGIDLFGQNFRAEYSHQKVIVPEDSKVDFFHNDSISVGTRLNLPYDFYYSMDPRLAVSYNMESYSKDSAGNLSLITRDPVENDDVEILEFSWNHSIGYDSVNWIGNFRNGFDASLSNSIFLASDLVPEFPVLVSTDFKAEIKYFWRINRFFNLSTRGIGLLSINRDMKELGSYMRGVRDDVLHGDKAFFWDIDMSISLIDWDGVGEGLFRPFFSLGYAHSSDSGILAYGAGADFILYIDKLSALEARVTVAVDLSQYVWSDGEKYEIDIDTSLSY